MQPCAAGRHAGEGGHVFARKLDKLRPHRVALAGNAADVARGVLDADDVLQLVQPLHRIHGHVDHAARRDVVDDDRNADRIVDRPEMLIKPFLGRLVVIGRHDQHRVGAGLLGVAGELDRLVRVVRAGAGDHRHAAARLVDADVDGAAVLLVAQRRALAGGADRHQPVRAGRDLPVDQSAERRLVDFPVLEGSDQGRHRSVKLRPLVHFALPARLILASHEASGRADT